MRLIVMAPNVRAIHHVLDTLINGSALVLNFFLIYFILAHSSGYIKAYKRVLLTTCVSDILLALITLIGQPVRSK